MDWMPFLAGVMVGVVVMLIVVVCLFDPPGWPRPSASFPPQPRDMPVPRVRCDIGETVPSSRVYCASTKCAAIAEPGSPFCIFHGSPAYRPPPLRTDGTIEPKTPRAISDQDALVVARLFLAKHFAPDAWVTIERSKEPEHGPHFTHKHVHVWTKREPEDAIACLNAFDEEWLALYPATMFLGFTIFPAFGAPPAHAEPLIGVEPSPTRFPGHPNAGPNRAGMARGSA